MYRSGHFFHSKENMTQVYPLVMISYGIENLPLICEISTVNLQVTQPCYEENDRAVRTYDALPAYMQYILVR